MVDSEAKPIFAPHSTVKINEATTLSTQQQRAVPSLKSQNYVNESEYLNNRLIAQNFSDHKKPSSPLASAAERMIP